MASAANLLPEIPAVGIAAFGDLSLKAVAEIAVAPTDQPVEIALALPFAGQDHPIDEAAEQAGR